MPKILKGKILTHEGFYGRSKLVAGEWSPAVNELER